MGMTNWKKHFQDRKSDLKKKGKSNSTFPRKGTDYKSKKERDKDGLLEKSTS
jgi:hypothetical protein